MRGQGKGRRAALVAGLSRHRLRASRGRRRRIEKQLAALVESLPLTLPLVDSLTRDGSVHASDGVSRDRHCALCRLEGELARAGGGFARARSARAALAGVAVAALIGSGIVLTAVRGRAPAWDVDALARQAHVLQAAVDTHVTDAKRLHAIVIDVRRSVLGLPRDAVAQPAVRATLAEIRRQLLRLIPSVEAAVRAEARRLAATIERRAGTGEGTDQPQQPTTPAASASPTAGAADVPR